MTTILITGVNGFIGAQYARRVKAKGWRVVGLDLQPGDQTGVCDHYRPIDLGSPEAATVLDACVADAAAAPAVILHAGGISGFMVATGRPKHIVDVNVAGTMPVLALAQRLGVRRTILCSTIMVYGPDETPGETRSESEYPKPISIYGASKVAIEALMHGSIAQFGLDAVALRLGHVYGPGRTTQCFIRDMLAAVRSGERCIIPQAGASIRQYVHIDDICDAFDRTFEATALPVRVFNISAGEVHTLAEVAALVRRTVGPFDVVFDDTQDLPNYRVGALSLMRARDVLGFVPAVPLATGIKSYWDQAFATPR